MHGKMSHVPSLSSRYVLESREAESGVGVVCAGSVQACSSAVQ